MSSIIKLNTKAKKIRDQLPRDTKVSKCSKTILRKRVGKKFLGRKIVKKGILASRNLEKINNKAS